MIKRCKTAQSSKINEENALNVYILLQKERNLLKLEKNEKVIFY